jgi:hypothetical protein
MACLELFCRKCGHTWFANAKGACPECGAEDPHAYFDEDDQPDYPDDFEPPEEE